jgi:hypothetical protein
MVLSSAAPDASDADLDRYAKSIVLSFLLDREALIANYRNSFFQNDVDEIRKGIASHREALKSLKEIGIVARKAANEPSEEEIFSQLDERMVSLKNRLPARPKKGRPRDELAQKVIEYVSRIYEGLTGKRPVRSIDRDTHKPTGDFYVFVKGIFDALSIRADADYQIRLYLESGC